jgi:hypothetical protein
MEHLTIGGAAGCACWLHAARHIIPYICEEPRRPPREARSESDWLLLRLRRWRGSPCSRIYTADRLISRQMHQSDGGRLFLLLLLAPATAAVTIDNSAPRRDQHGNILNAHDGHIITVNGTFWLFGTSYTHCLMTDATACLGTCGMGGGKCAYPISPGVVPNHPACGWTNNDFAAYSSTDLVNWRLENPSVLPADLRPNGIYFRPKVMWNEKTAKFVLWMNYVTEGWDKHNSTEFEREHWSSLATAVSDSPQGPYSFVGGHLPPIAMGTGNKSYVHGDFGVFTDPDSGKGYVVYNAYDHRNQGQHSNSVDLLTDDFTKSSGATSGFFAEWTVRNKYLSFCPQLNFLVKAIVCQDRLGTNVGKPDKQLVFSQDGKDAGDEAQVMIKRDGTYWAIISQGCCFCSSGASAFVYSAPSPLGPFTLHNDIQKPSSVAPSPPPPPPGPAKKEQGPEATKFCGGAGGQEFPSGGPHQQVVLSCAEPSATIEAIDWCGRCRPFSQFSVYICPEPVLAEFRFSYESSHTNAPLWFSAGRRGAPLDARKQKACGTPLRTKNAAAAVQASASTRCVEMLRSAPVFDSEKGPFAKTGSAQARAQAKLNASVRIPQSQQLLTQWTEGTCTAERFAKVANASAVTCEHANTSHAEEIVGKACTGKNSCTVELTSATFGDDPCFGVYKSLFVAAHCSAGQGSVTAVTPPAPPAPAPPASGGVTIPAQQVRTRLFCPILY